MNNKSTVREQAIEALEAAIMGIRANEPLSDPYGVEFSEVYREPPEGLTTGKKAVAIIIEGSENKQTLNFPVVMCTLAVQIEINVMKVPKESMSQTINDHVGAVERAISSDRTLGGVVIDTTIQGNEVTPQGVYKAYGSGVTRLMLTYRHTQADPRQPIGG